MALEAGRVGVSPTEVDPYGKIKSEEVAIIKRDVSELSGTKANKEDVDALSETIASAKADGFIGKNLLKNEAISINKDGRSFVVNSDGTIRVSGNGTNTSTFDLFVKKPFEYETGDYIFSIGVVGSSTTVQGWIGLRNASDTAWETTKNVRETEQIIHLVKGQKYLVEIEVLGTYSETVTFYPMLRRASISDNTYETYVPSNNVLSDEIAKDYHSISAVSGDSETGYVAIGNSNKLALVLFDNNENILSSTFFTYTMTNNGRAVGVYHPQAPNTVYALAFIDKTNKTVKLKHIGQGIVRIYAF